MSLWLLCIVHHFWGKNPSFPNIITAEIVRAGVHVERAIQRLKLFNILNNKIDWNIYSHMNNIMTITAALVNLSPILGDNKFEVCCG